MSHDLSQFLSTEDAARYQQHLASYTKTWSPVGEHEENLVQAIAHAWWRLARIPVLEEALYWKGARQFESKVADLPPAVRPAMLRLETYLAYEKQFRNLASQERALARHAAQLKAELENVQQTRNRKEAQNFSIAAALYTDAKREGKKYDPQADGFEFSTTDLDDYLRGQRAATGYRFAR